MVPPVPDPARRSLPPGVRLVLESLLVGVATVGGVVLALLLTDAVTGRLPDGDVAEVLTGVGVVLALVAVEHGLPTAALVGLALVVVVVPVLALRGRPPVRAGALAAAVGLLVALLVVAQVLPGTSGLSLAGPVGALAGALAAWRSQRLVTAWVSRVDRVGTPDGPVRCAAGTRTPGQLLGDPALLPRRLTGRPFGSPSDDLRALEEGQPVAVGALRSAGPRARAGLLVLHPGADGLRAAWHPHRPLRGYGPAEDRPALVGAPVGSAPVRWRRLPRTFRPVTLLVAGSAWQLAVQAPDAGLLRQVVPAAPPPPTPPTPVAEA
ncbi:hypothetical protein [Aquipuribacter hungaricus]|uniref:Uncharacterized protein n=1 Tax=Aquipuribacter hungaricus TaxID=545624 RepID=A0ABV7WGP2_9MICO